MQGIYRCWQIDDEFFGPDKFARRFRNKVPKGDSWKNRGMTYFRQDLSEDMSPEHGIYNYLL